MLGEWLAVDGVRITALCDVVPEKGFDYGRATIRLRDLESSPDLTLVAHARA